MRFVTAVLLVLVVPASAAAQQPGVDVALEPHTPASATTVSVAVDGAKLDQSRLPKGFTLTVQRGFAFDARAVAQRCSAAQADAHQCPAASQVGTGRATAAVQTLLGTSDVQAELAAYLTDPVRSGDLAGVALTIRVPSFGVTVGATARILRTADGGLELRADDVAPAGSELPPGVTFRLRSVGLRIGASRTETVRTTKRKRLPRKRGQSRPRFRRVTTTKRVRRALLTTPRTCSGTWTGRAVVAFADGGPGQTLAVALPCRRSRG
ncbi:hypothetical protein [Conexibacter sp. SYSU D00693]|uniref:hypothetical protein n=1 Tax=Conexibacter sp. SYSU D00693 TaxID=2812560 RepID=UPI00196A682B|nr:hypothetical protein [Conexibacter sp. SYSU D00693]